MEDKGQEVLFRNESSRKRQIILHGEPISSDYRLLGKDEDALTFALGHCLVQPSVGDDLPPHSDGKLPDEVRG